MGVLPFMLSENRKSGSGTNSKTGLKIRSKIRFGWIAALPGILLCAAALNLTVSAAHRAFLQRGIAEEVLRFHVLANSDSEEDQRVKYLVRDAVLEWMRTEQDVWEDEPAPESVCISPAGESCSAEVDFREEGPAPENVSGKLAGESCSAEKDFQKDEPVAENVSGSLVEKGQSAEPDGGKESELRFLGEHLGEIERIANTILEDEGAPYRAKASIENCYFPDRTYGSCTFPSGWYDALRICLGEAQGQNWWCVLYPALCFSDCLHAVVEEEGLADLKEVLTADEYESLLREPEEWKIAFRWLPFFS